MGRNVATRLHGRTAASQQTFILLVDRLVTRRVPRHQRTTTPHHYLMSLRRPAAPASRNGGKPAAASNAWAVDESTAWGAMGGKAALGGESSSVHRNKPIVTITNDTSLAVIDPTAELRPMLKPLNRTNAIIRLRSCEREASAACTIPACHASGIGRL